MACKRRSNSIAEQALLQIFTLTLTLTLTLHDHKLRVNQIRRNRGGRTLVEMQGVTKRPTRPVIGTMCRTEFDSTGSTNTKHDAIRT